MSDHSGAGASDDDGAMQARVAEFLRRPASYGEAVEGVDEIATHISRIFLAGPRVYKMKRAVAFPYCDFSTLEKRRAACERELELNRRTAPELYLDVVAVRRDAEGRLSLGEESSAEESGGEEFGAGEPVEWLVVQRRFDQDALLDRMAGEGRLTQEILRDLGDAVARFHAEAERTPEFGGADGLSRVIEENAGEWPQWPEIFPPARAAALDGDSRRALQAVSGLLDRRRTQGRVRRCHGDLHLRNIVMLDGRPRLFDAIEFNERLACIDTLYDLAFLLMDLEQRGQRPGANLVFNRVMRIEDDLEGLAALPLFLSLRAAVRAKIEATIAAGGGDDAEAETRRAGFYFAAAESYLRPPPPCLVAIGGLSGSGKTTQARRLAPFLGPAPGAVHLRSDVIRKQLAGVAPEERLPESAYGPQASAAVYAALNDRARRALAAGHAVVADAVFAKPEERAAIEAVAGDAGVAFRGVWLEADAAQLEARVERRAEAATDPARADASDATAAVVRRQLAYDLGRLDWTRTPAGGSADEVAERLLALPEISGVPGFRPAQDSKPTRSL